VEGGQDHLHTRDLVLGVDVDRDPAAIVADGDGAIDVDGDLDLVAMSGEMLVDGVVQDLRDAVVEGAFIGAADVHARLLADSLESFEFAQLGGVICARGARFFVCHDRSWFGRLERP